MRGRAAACVDLSGVRDNSLLFTNRTLVLSVCRKFNECTITVVMGTSVSPPFHCTEVHVHWGGALHCSCSHFPPFRASFSASPMHIRVLLFGILKTSLGQSSEILDLPEGARVDDLLAQYKDRFPQLEAILSTLAVSVNQEYSRADRTLAAGDEVGLLPPVSGGASEAASTPDLIAIVKEPIETLAVLNRLKRPQDGAVVVFEGVVRDHTRARRTLYLDYEAYEPMAIKQMHTLAEQARERFAVSAISVIHRLGRLEIGETSVLIVVSSEHRAVAFEACRWLIDTLKKTVPIWKKEYFEDGAVWADGEPFPEEIRPPGGTMGRYPASK